MAAAPPNYRVLAQQDAARYGLGPWFVNQIQQESGFNPNARSGAGAEGIAQFMPGTAKGVGLENPYDPVASLAAAAQFDAKLVKQYGSVPRALSAYNSGNPDAYLNPSFAGGQTYNYVRNILGGHSGTAAPMPDTGQTSQSSPLVAATIHPAAAVAPPPPDYRPQLAHELAAAAGSQGHNLQAFYATLRQALEARAHAAAAPQQAAAADIPAATGQVVSAALSGLAGGFLPAHAVYKPGRLDQGHDFQTNPGGAIIAPGSGVVVRVASDPNGFGPGYPIVKFDTGPYAGKTVYIGHTLAQLKPGQQFKPGQVISLTGTRPIGNAAVPGWAEIGYAPGGTPGGFGQKAPF